MGESLKVCSDEQTSALQLPSSDVVRVFSREGDRCFHYFSMEYLYVAMALITLKKYAPASAQLLWCFNSVRPSRVFPHTFFVAPPHIRASAESPPAHFQRWLDSVSHIRLRGFFLSPRGRSGVLETPTLRKRRAVCRNGLCPGQSELHPF